MADFKAFNEGINEILSGAVDDADTAFFLLSTRDCDTHAAANTLAGGVGEITGTGYARQSQGFPTPASQALAFAQMTWDTGSATDWSASVKSVVLVTTSDNTGKAICAWNLQTGGAARDLSGANTTEKVTPTLNLA